jgi:hypothetical protein
MSEALRLGRIERKSARRTSGIWGKENAGQIALAGAREGYGLVPMQPKNASIGKGLAYLALLSVDGEAGRAIQLDGIPGGEAKNRLVFSGILE